MEKLYASLNCKKCICFECVNIQWINVIAPIK